MVQRHILIGGAAVLSPTQEFALKKKVADNFRVHPTAIYVVGSAKLGFSIKPSRRWAPYGSGSDVDLAIVSDALFDTYWKKILLFDESGAFWQKRPAFLESLLQGWIRPDRLPPSHAFPEGKAWWEFFNAISASGEFGNAGISAGLYRTVEFLEVYQKRCMATCKASEKIDAHHSDK